jgi:hypothetical protein
MMAEPRSIQEIEAELISVGRRFLAGEINEEQRREQADRLMEEKRQARTQEMFEVKQGAKPIEDVMVVPPPAPRTRYLPGSDVNAARREAYYGEYRNNLDRGYSEEEADRLAIEKINRIIKPATMDFVQQPDIFVSRIVDPELKLVEDSRTGDIRKATDAEMLQQALLRQRIGSTGHYARIIEQQKREALEERRKMPEEGLKDFAYKFYKTLLDPMALQPYMVDIPEEPEATEQFEMPERSGLVTESFLGTALRNLNALSAATAVGMQEMMPGTQETDDYRMAESQDAVDQLIINMATGQGIPSVIKANKPIVDLIGEDAAYYGGVGIELLMPITPLPAASLTGKAARAGAAGAPRAVKEAVHAASSPTEYLKLRAQMNVSDDLLEKVNSGKSSKQIMDEIYSDPTVTDAQIARSKLNTKTAEYVGDQVGAITALRGKLDAEGSIPISKLGYSRSKPAVRGVLAEVVKNADEPVTHLTRANAGRILSREIAKFEEAAKGSQDFAAIYNEAKAVQRQITQAGKLEGKPGTLRTDALNSATQSDLARVVFGRRMAEKGMSKADIGRIIVAAKSAKKPLTSGDLAKVMLGREGIDFTTARLDDVIEAVSKNTTAKTRQWFQNTLPENDLVEVVGGGTVVRSPVLKSKKKMAEYRKALTARNQQIGQLGADGKYKVKKDARDELIADIIDLKGIDNVRQSDDLRKLIAQIDKGAYDSAYDMVVRQAMHSSEAIDVLGAFRLKDAGEQYVRARMPEELRGDVFALSKRPEEFFKGSVAEASRDYRMALRILTTRSKNSPAFTPQIGVQASIDFKRFEKAVNNEVQKLYSQLQKETREAYKRTGDQMLAMDEPGLAVQKVLLDDAADAVDKTVQRAFDGDYIKFIDAFIEPRFKEQIRSLMNRTDAKQVLEFNERELRNVVASGNQELAMKLALEYQTFFTKTDKWKEMLQAYYGSTFIGETGANINIYTYIKKFPEAASRVSNVKDLTFSNWLSVVEEISKKFPEQQVLQTIPLVRPAKNAKPARAVPYLQYILGNRRGKLVSTRQQEMVQNNPSLTVEYYPTYFNSTMQVNIAPLAVRYSQMFIDVLSELKASGIPQDLSSRVTAIINSRSVDRLRRAADPAFLARKPLVDLVDVSRRLAERQYDLVRKISGSKRQKLVETIRTKMEDTSTLDPDLTTLKGQLGSELDFELREMQRLSADIVDEIFRAIDVPEIARQRNQVKATVNDRVWNMFFGGGDVYTKYYADPTLSVMEDVVTQIKAFYLKNGLSTKVDLPSAFNSNKPLFGQIKNTDFRLAYGKQEQEVFKQLNDMAASNNLRSTMESLQKPGDSTAQWFASYVSNAWGAARRLMTTGMLYMSSRYHGTNIMTWPIISMATIQMPRTLKALSPRVWHAASRVSQSVLAMPDDAVAFTSKGGRKYTARELRLLEDRTNIGMTRGRIEFYEAQAKEVVTGVDMDLAGQSKSRLPSWILRNLNPQQRILAARFADQADLMYRRAVWYSALMDDIPMEQASDLAKRSLLDYGNISDTELKALNRYTMFWSFTRNMGAEMINSVAKAVTTDKPSFAIRAVAASKRQQEDQGTWLYGDDRSKLRLYSMYKGMVDGEPAYTYGPVNPVLESFESMLNIFTAGSSVIAGEKDFGQAVGDAVNSMRYRPLLDTIVRVIQGKYKRNVPPEHVYLAKSMGVWEEYSRTFGVYVKEYPRIQEPVYGEREVQYEFDEAGRKKFHLFQYGLVLFGIDRLIRDYTRAMMATGAVPEEMDMQRFANQNPFLYLLSAETSLRTGMSLEKARRNQKNVERELNQLEKEQK